MPILIAYIHFIRPIYVVRRF